ncbi:MAG: choice-of-anchor tandem repeat GloVer-containing protein [Terriglobales bacterium]
MLWNFGHDGDGASPSGRLIFDASGNIFGTTGVGGTNCLSNGGCGTVFELSPSAGGWTETVLYDFCSATFCTDGSIPLAGLVFDKQGNLYGTTYQGGSNAVGTVFELSPSQNGLWTETVLWSFGSTKTDGESPRLGALNWDASGNLYGTTDSGGVYGQGIVYELSPNSTGGWTETIIHSFDGQNGDGPDFGVAIDNAGNLYGTTVEGGSAGLGLVYRLSPSPTGKWKETVIYTFKGQNGSNPVSPISIDASGSFYGTFSTGGKGSCEYGACGGVFKLTPRTGGGVSESSFFFDGQDGGNSYSGVVLDNQTGTLFGTTLGGNDVYAIRGTKETVLYTFCSLPNCADGLYPGSGLLSFHDGKLYGVTSNGGIYENSGVAYSLAP